MRTRTIMTVALLTAAGCGTTRAPRQPQASKPADSRPAADTAATSAVAPAPTPAPTTTVMSVPAPVTASSAPTPPAAPLTSAQLELLADELRGADASTVGVRLAHFRPLCDAKGYPLVGNMATKSADPGAITAFCAGVRSKATP